MRHHVSKIPSREHEVRFPRLTRDPLFDRVDPPRVFLSLGGGGSFAGKTSSNSVNLAENGHLVRLLLCWRRQGSSLGRLCDVILQKPASYQLIKLVTQREAVVNVMAKGLVELAPRVFRGPNTLSVFAGRLNPSAILGTAIRSFNSTTKLYLTGLALSLAGRSPPAGPRGWGFLVS